MATVRALSVALLLAIFFAACACALAAERMPKNRYISYAGVPQPTGKNKHHYYSGIGTTPPGCSALTGKCNPNRRAPTKPPGGTMAAAGLKGDYMTSHAALPTDKHPALEKKAGAGVPACLDPRVVTYKPCCDCDVPLARKRGR